ncbi:hypothetical protein CVD25_12790 [Bacillus canaveralius]|uniref:Cytosolic protein n=1 Tax=Bacillus canaveralius TaxID=1403243 RepID=A0A2N5GNK2_9BACI|nr:MULTISPECIES: YlbD family protein [Bacillus]PLR84086.1 hypothetical protein CU635_07215 [Bacillus canaveralius]PLR87319.1 hypothetical protein CVD23_03690 [Bacillus sp. V33-4]PLR96268.1 hypothetical protein CVD25_12790 [Bacillus canaveralius]RSK53547.1 hypothetical protein EJA13_08220 [Bacillus canaveralius]
MVQKKLHPSVEQFKDFVKANPKIIQEVRKGNTTWKELYEDWYLFGEDDSRWDSFREGKKPVIKESGEKKTDWIAQITSVIKKMDQNQMEEHIQNISQALTAVQGVISQFQRSPQQPGPQQANPPTSPFMFRKD